MEADDVGAGEELVELHQLRSRGPGAGFGGERIVRDHLHLERRRAARDL